MKGCLSSNIPSELFGRIKSNKQLSLILFFYKQRFRTTANIMHRFWFHVSIISVAFAQSLLEQDPDQNRNVTELIKSKHYTVEDHFVHTSDGYILSVQRVGPPGGFNLGKSPVLLLHALQTDASMWYLNFPDQSIGFLLPDAGYDVWVISFRGSNYSRTHETLTTNDKEFWNFSFDEMATKDLPAFVDHVLKVTRKEQISIVSFSMGCTIALIYMAESPDFNKKVKAAMLMAPGSTFRYSTSPLRLIAPGGDIAVAVINNSPTNGELNTDPALIGGVTSLVCFSRKKSVKQMLCEKGFTLAEGVEGTQLNESRLAVYLAHFPSTTSIRTPIHYGQIMNKCLLKKTCVGIFCWFKDDCFLQKYDFGRNNLAHYGQNTPPRIQLKNIKDVKLGFYYAPKDDLSSQGDNEHILIPILKDIIINQTPYLVPDKNFGHLDFIVALSARELVYNKLLEDLGNIVPA